MNNFFLTQLTLHRIAQSNIVSLIVILYKMFPQSLFRHFSSPLADFFYFFFRLIRK